MRALALLALAAVALIAAASAQTIRAPQLQLRPNLASLQQTADQRWAEVFARDEDYMRALRAAIAAEIGLRRARGEDVAELMAEQASLQEMNMSFNMQYLSLQEQMQHESRRFTLLSNIMKTKHDTVRNSISNVR